MRCGGGEDGRQESSEHGREFSNDDVADGLGLEVRFRVRLDVVGRRGGDFGRRRGIRGVKVGTFGGRRGRN